MISQTHRIPFEVGEQYRNEDGVYTVLRIEGPDMVIQYEDGRTLESPIKLQQRIWERIREDERFAARQAEARAAARRKGSSRSRASLGRDFHGLQETDFSSDVTGTAWRRRTDLAGLLAARLSTASGLTFESHAVYRRAEVYIVQEERWNSQQSTHAAKFFFGLSESGARYGFYVEKPDTPMDNTWDWLRFIAALAHDKTLQARTLIAMEHCNLRGQICPGGCDVAEPAYTLSAQHETLYLEAQGGDERTPIDWARFTELLSEVPDDQRCDCYLSAHMEKTHALSLGAGLAQEAANTYNALLPLYAASVHR